MNEAEYRALLMEEYGPHEYEPSEDHDDCDYCGQPEGDTDFHAASSFEDDAEYGAGWNEPPVNLPARG